jgi:GntR family transcriptional repressor for pyruvate dehydrogenase complex
VEDDFKIKKNSLSDQIYEVIVKRITGGVWKTGDRLPSEAELADMFGVNRLTIRGALQKLNAMGVLETRNGSGTYVTKFNFEDYIRAASAFYIDSNLLDDLMAFRMTIEVESIRLAAQNGTAEEVKELERLALEHRAVYMTYTGYGRPIGEAWVRSTAASDLAFHEQIYKMTHNQYYMYTFAMIQDALYDYMMLCASKWKPEHFEAYPAGVKHRDIHYLVYEAIRDKDVERCVKDYETMIRSYSASDGSMPYFTD